MNTSRFNDWKAANMSVACDVCSAAAGALCAVPAVLECDCRLCRALAERVRRGESFCGGGTRELAARDVRGYDADWW